MPRGFLAVGDVWDELEVLSPLLECVGEAACLV